MGSNDRVKITLEKDDCDEDISIKPEPTINMIDQRSMVFNELNNDRCNNLVNTNKSNAQDSSVSESIKLEIFDNDLDDELLDLDFEEGPQNSETIVKEPLALIETDKLKQVDTQKDEQKIVKIRSLKKNDKNAKPVSTKLNKIREVEMNKNKCENLETDQSHVNREEKKKKKIRSVNREITFDENKWKLIHFTEEEAERKFEERREDSFYKTAPYKCDLCLKGFSSENILDSHKSLHNEDRGELCCKFCKMGFCKLSKLKRHIDAHYNEYHCLQCSFIGRTASGAKFHEEMHNGIGYTCETCNENFLHKSTFYTHMRVIHRSSYVCGICGESYVTSKGLATHKARAHQIYAPRKKNKSKPIAEDELEDRTYCTECKLNFETKEAYSIHLLSATNHAITQDGQTLCQVQEDKIEDKCVPYKSYRQKRHHRCGENFSSVKTCIAHHKQAHPRVPYYMQKRVVCDVCGASIQAGNLKIHMNTHTKKIQYPCSICARVFYIKETLKKHMLTHTGEKPWACALCDKTYQQMGSLKLHERTIHQRQKPPPRRRRANNVTVVASTSAEPAKRTPLPQCGSAHTIIVTSDEKADTADQVMEKVRTAVDARKTGVEAARKLPLVVIRDVRKENTDEDIVKSIKKQNKHATADLDWSSIEVKVKFRRRAKNDLESHPVLEVSPELWRRLVDAGTYVDVQCTQCLGFSHTGNIARARPRNARIAEGNTSPKPVKSAKMASPEMYKLFARQVG
ncbi:Zinc finger protein 229 [Eumeta japonica]|uniref:Zinc finger protein 229 n=1 Tax=Eumeta variegata TaxID=151549 RepID=A0A4C1UEJ1_EUMVA|nr:Zinc finger protein 229 [Eumeta japonica]